MGLAASQGRLLLLTARKSDLELQAQRISQERLLLAMEQERIATEYSDKINNQIVEVGVIGSNGQRQFVPLTMQGLAQAFGNQVRVVTKRTSTGTDVVHMKDKNGKNVDLDSGAMTQTQDETKFANQDKFTGANFNNLTADSELMVRLRDEDWIIQTMDGGTWSDVSIDGSDRLRTTSYTKDDTQAKADYDRAMARVQRLDKQLELKLNQVETQHKAVETEIESVDKIIQNNIEKSFKYFS